MANHRLPACIAILESCAKLAMYRWNCALLGLNLHSARPDVLMFHILLANFKHLKGTVKRLYLTVPPYQKL